MFALLVGVSGRSAGAAKLARASAAKSSGRAELATGAWAMSDAYINRTANDLIGDVDLHELEAILWGDATTGA